MENKHIYLNAILYFLLFLAICFAIGKFIKIAFVLGSLAGLLVIIFSIFKVDGF